MDFQTKPGIALDQIRRARERGIPQGVVLADAGYGTDTNFRAELTKLEMAYVVGIQSTTTIWKPGEQPKPAPRRKGNIGRPRKLLPRDAKSQTVLVRDLAMSLPGEAWRKVTWRQGAKHKLQSRFATPCGCDTAIIGARNRTRKNGC
jgi:SRSO17 transposase